MLVVGIERAETPRRWGINLDFLSLPVGGEAESRTDRSVASVFSAQVQPGSGWWMVFIVR